MKLLIDDKRSKLCKGCKVVKSVYDFNKDKNAPTGLASRCKHCMKVYQQERHKKCMSDPEWVKKRREVNRERSRVGKLKAIEHFGDKCHDCGISYPPYVYDIHHLDGGSKEYNPSALLKSGELSERALKELEKCVLLCSNCHRGRHYG